MLLFSIFSDIALHCYLLWTIFYILLVFYLIPGNIYLLKVNNGNSRIKVRNVFKVNNKNVNFEHVIAGWDPFIKRCLVQIQFLHTLYSTFYAD